MTLRLNNKRGQVTALVSIFITAVLAVILIANLLFPTVKGVTNTVLTSEVVNRNQPTIVQNFTLTKVPVDTLVSITNSTGGLALVENTNFTLEKSSGFLNFLVNKSANANYTVAYYYQPTNYLTDATNRVLMGMVLLAGLIGLIYWLFVNFGLG